MQTANIQQSFASAEDKHRESLRQLNQQRVQQEASDTQWQQMQGSQSVSDPKQHLCHDFGCACYDFGCCSSQVVRM